MRLPRVMIAAPASNSGKTLVTCGILQALVDRGLSVSSFKCGPDYIDPMFHSRVIGAKSRNLDTFFCDDVTLRHLFARSAASSDVSVIEGVMGFYDGVGGGSTKGSAYDVSCRTGAPVVLVVDCAGMALSVNAVIKGFMEYRPNSIRGVILNNVHPSIYVESRRSIESELGVKVLGYVPNVSFLALESRHLGLVLPDEVDGLRGKMAELGRILEGTLDLDALLDIAREAPDMDAVAPEVPRVAGRPRIALARDEAFCFIYEDNLEILREMGAEIVEFSPLHDRMVPDCDGMIFYGGYPELHARELEGNEGMRADVLRRISSGTPCMAECGGFMYLHDTLTDCDGATRRGVGAVKGSAEDAGRLVRFGYVTLTAERDVLGFRKGDSIRGHEFHRWNSTDNGDCLTAERVSGDRYRCGHGSGTLLAGYPHLFYYSNPSVPFRFLERCLEARATGSRGTDDS